jgi:hypothetical protein
VHLPLARHARRAKIRSRRTEGDFPQLRLIANFTSFSRGFRVHVIE